MQSTPKYNKQKAESPDTDGYHVYSINTPTSKMRSVWIGEQYIDGLFLKFFITFRRYTL